MSNACSHTCPGYTGHLKLQVRDNGGGIRKSKLSDPQSLGLLGMRERAMLVGGNLVIAGVRGKGTTVTVRIPVETSS